MFNKPEFMKSSRDKGMSDEEYETIRDEYDKLFVKSADIVKKTLMIFLIGFAISFIALYLLCVFNSAANYGNGLGNYTWLLVEFSLAIFFYGLKEDDKNKRYNYETDKKILLGYIKSKIAKNKIKLGLVIGLGIIFVILNIICWWFAFQYLAIAADDFIINY